MENQIYLEKWMLALQQQHYINYLCIQLIFKCLYIQLHKL